MGFMGSKPLRISFDEVYIFIKIYDGIRYLILFGCGLYGEICNRVIYIISEKVVLQIVLITTLQESGLIHIIRHQQKKH